MTKRGRGRRLAVGPAVLMVALAACDAPGGPGAVPEIEAGRRLAEGSAGCRVCHRIGGQGGELGPELDGLPDRASARRPGTDAVAYVLESLLRPAEFVVEGHFPVMPAADRPPASLTDDEIRAVARFLLSSPGKPAAAVPPAAMAADRAAHPDREPPAARGERLLHARGCTGCHDLVGGQRRVGPPLTDVGARLSPAEILEAIVDPDAVVTAGYDRGTMPRTYARGLTSAELEAIVEHLIGPAGDR